MVNHQQNLIQIYTNIDTIHCDVLVIGAGISGIIAAKTAAQNNLKTLLLDEKSEIGGSTIYQNSEYFKIDNKISSEWLSNEIR